MHTHTHTHTRLIAHKVCYEKSLLLEFKKKKVILRVRIAARSYVVCMTPSVEAFEFTLLFFVYFSHTCSLRRPDGRVDVLTKGDNNDVDDRGLYAPDQRWLNKKHIIGRAVG